MSTNGEFWVAHASRVLVSASRRNELGFGFHSARAVNLEQSARSRDGFASTRDACATQSVVNARTSYLNNPAFRELGLPWRSAIRDPQSAIL